MRRSPISGERVGRGTSQNNKEILAFAAISLFIGAEGQNRTADTGIFSRIIEKIENPVITKG